MKGGHPPRPVSARIAGDLNRDPDQAVMGARGAESEPRQVTVTRRDRRPSTWPPGGGPRPRRSAWYTGYNNGTNTESVRYVPRRSFDGSGPNRDEPLSRLRCHGERAVRSSLRRQPERRARLSPVSNLEGVAGLRNPVLDVRHVHRPVVTWSGTGPAPRRPELGGPTASWSAVTGSPPVVMTRPGVPCLRIGNTGRSQGRCS